MSNKGASGSGLKEKKNISPVFKNEPGSMPLSISKYSVPLVISSDEDTGPPLLPAKRSNPIPQAIRDLNAKVEALEDRVLYLQDARDRLVGERNFAVSLVNDFHSFRRRLVAMGNSLLTATEPND